MKIKIIILFLVAFCLFVISCRTHVSPAPVTEAQCNGSVNFALFDGYGAKEIIRTNDNGYAVLCNGFIAKLDCNYQLSSIMQLRYLGMILNIMQKNDGGFFLAGGSRDSSLLYNNSYIAVTDSNGNCINSREIPEYDAVIYAYVTAAKKLDNGHFFVSAENGYFAEFDNSLNEIWSKKITSTAGINDEYCEVVEVSDGLVFAGKTPLHGGSFGIVKMDKNANFLWAVAESFGSPGTDVATSITRSEDGGFVACGHTLHDNFGNLLKVNSIGQVVWKKFYSNSTGDVKFEKVICVNGGYLVLGFVGVKLLAVKIDSDGNVIRENVQVNPYITSLGVESGFKAGVLDDDGSVTVLGNIDDHINPSSSKWFVIRVDADGNFNF